jgi:hypothetical protein
MKGNSRTFEVAGALNHGRPPVKQSAGTKLRKQKKNEPPSWRLFSIQTTGAMSVRGPPLHLLRDSNTSVIGGKADSSLTVAI